MLETGKALKVGHGADANTTMGPLTSPRGIDKALQHVEDAKKNGAKILFGGNKLDIKGGYFFEPTVITDAHEGLLLAQEEQFAPVMALFSFDTEDEVVEKANNTSVSLKYHYCCESQVRNAYCSEQMGLASYFFTKNIDRTWRLLENLEAGMIGMNTGR
jgi:acyl-CoA reductase-like NAD-dependent aldehyde dehydrogenase